MAQTSQKRSCHLISLHLVASEISATITSNNGKTGVNVLGLVNRFSTSCVKCWTTNLCFHVGKGSIVIMNQLELIYNSQFKDSHSHHIHTCFLIIDTGRNWLQISLLFWHFRQVQSPECRDLYFLSTHCVCSLKNFISSHLFIALRDHNIIKSASKHFLANVTGSHEASCRKAPLRIFPKKHIVHKE